MAIDNNVNIFEEATYRKLRFVTPQGVLNVEDVWSLPLHYKHDGVTINSIAADIANQLKEFENANDILGIETAGKASSAKEEELNLQLSILKAIAARKNAEIDKAIDAQKNKQKREYIDRLIAEKKDDELKSKSLEELEKLREDM